MGAVFDRPAVSGQGDCGDGEEVPASAGSCFFNGEVCEIVAGDVVDGAADFFGRFLVAVVH